MYKGCEPGGVPTMDRDKDSLAKRKPGIWEI